MHILLIQTFFNNTFLKSTVYYYIEAERFDAGDSMPLFLRIKNIFINCK